MAKLKLGMVGGGQGAFIGGVHRIATRKAEVAHIKKIKYVYSPIGFTHSNP